MDRRELLLTAGAAALAAMSAPVLAADHAHHHESGKYQALMNAALDCVQRGQLCINHCIHLLGEGDKQMAACAASVQELLAVCGSLHQLAAYESKHLGKFARVAMDVCKACEDECRKHEKKHKECRECAEACAACSKECKAVAV